LFIDDFFSKTELRMFATEEPAGLGLSLNFGSAKTQHSKVGVEVLEAKPPEM